ncbi:PDR/VanB family oxidoreductase [Cereibacter sphaeroides]|nr:PDR/VanB family oxidoreductase [Cereibacter sphaeroides]
MAAPRLIMKLRVAALRLTGGETLVVEFQHPRKPQLPSFTPGAHVDLHLPDGKVRQYSLCGDPADRSRYVIAIKREAQGVVSGWLHDHLREGMILPVSAPRNHFPMRPTEGPVTLLAAGIGITPVLSMARALAAEGRPFALHYVAPSRASAPLLDDLEALCPEGSLHLHLREDTGARPDLAALLATPAEGAQLYHCGPAGFMAAVEAASRHWPEGSVHSEAFQPPDLGPPQPFTLRLTDGRDLPVAADETALQVLRGAGVPLMASCENGLCGSCECGWSEGTPLHRDRVLTPEARTRRFIPCVSRAEGVIALDL